MRGIIYKATNTVNGKCYIGQTGVSLEARKRKHISAAEKRDIYFCNALRKYGKENFQWEILMQDVPRDQLNSEEMAAILAAGSFGKNGYNSNEGGGGNYGYKHSDEAKQKLSALKIGVHPSEETRRKLSEARKGNKNSLGNHHSEESKKKMSVSQRKVIHTAEWSAKIAEANKGKVFSVESRRKMSLAKKAQVHTEEQDRKHSIAMTGAGNPMFGRKRPDTAERNRQRCQSMAA